MFKSDSGFITMKANGNSATLSVEPAGSVFELQNSSADNCQGSFGLNTDIDGTFYRIDISSTNGANGYIHSDEGSYPHTSFFFYEIVEKELQSSEITITASDYGVTTLIINGAEHYLHVYDAESNLVLLEDTDSTIVVNGYELPDEELHDESFYSYQCSISDGTITFCAKGEGSDIVVIGAMPYKVKVRASSAEASLNGTEFKDFGQAMRSADTETERLSSANIVTVLSDNLDFNGTIKNGVLVDLNGFYGDTSGIMPSFEAIGEKDDNSVISHIYPRIIDDTQYLFLPSSADFNALNLNLPEGTVVSAADGTSGQTVVGSDGTFDATLIFGSMDNPGDQYPISIEYSSGNFSITINLVLMRSANVSSLYIDLDTTDIDGDLMDWLNDPEKHEINDGTALMIDSDGTEVVCCEGILSFHARGNGGLGDALQKSGYLLKLKKKAVLAGDIKAKSWVLLGNGISYRDMTHYSTAVGMSLYQMLNSEETDDFAVSYEPVDLYINGEYRGTYLVLDKINDDRVDINSSKYVVEDEDNRIEVDSSSDPVIAAGIQKYYYSEGAELEESGAGGYIIEISGYTEKADFITRRGVPIEIHEPESATKEQVQQIAKYYQEFEDALYAENGYNSAGKHYTDYIDITSWAKMYAVKAFIEDQDFFWGSQYFYINAENGEFTSRLCCCAAWDFDASSTIINGGDTELYNTDWEGGPSTDYKQRLAGLDDFFAELTKINNEKLFLNNAKSFSDIITDMVADGGFVDEFYNRMNYTMCMNAVIWGSGCWSDDMNVTMKTRLETRLENWNSFFK